MAIKRSERIPWKIQILPAGKLEGFGFWLLSSIWSGMEFTAKTACHTPVKQDNFWNAMKSQPESINGGGRW